MTKQARRLDDKTALVTGGGRGVGRAIALRLGQEGADVLLTYRSRRELAESAVAELREMGRKATAIPVDLEGTAQLDALCDRIRETLDAWDKEHLDIAIPNAGVITLGPFDRLTEADLDRQYETNYKSVFFLLQRLVPMLADGGRIVTVGSGTTHHAFPPLIAYAPIKAAIETLTFYLASMLGSRGITVNAVAPGALNTDFNAGLFEAMPQVPGYIAEQTALGRVGLPSDVAGVVAFLCSDDAGWISGHRLDTSGGFKL